MVAAAIAIIPARGGSKRIPRKNIVPFGGKPMLAWTIEAALNSGCFAKVLVSTEDEEIAEVARRYGAEVPFLRNSHFDDQSTVSEAVCSALEQAQKLYGRTFSYVAQLMANCPLRGAEDIKSAMGYFSAGTHEFQISCFKFGWMNPWWAVKLDGQNYPQPMFPEALKTRSQDLPPLYCPTGAIWLAKPDALLRSRSFYGPGYKFFSLDWRAAVDIDDYEDLAMAQVLLTQMSQSTEACHASRHPH
jgi:CMP-N-acetylneuraminic acid synthetase